MTTPRVIWRHSSETEANRLIQTACQIANRFYFKQGFFVLSRFIPGNSRVIYFPKLAYRQISGFWEKTKISHLEIKIDDQPDLAKQIMLLLPAEKINAEKIKASWLKIEKSFWNFCSQLLPQYAYLVASLEIRPTKYGSIATAGSFRELKPQPLIVYIREDASSANLAEAILTGLLSISLSREGYQWPEVEAIIDFLLTKSTLAQFFPDYQPTLDSLRQKEQAQLAKESRQYLSELGVPMGEFFTLCSGKIFLNNKPFSGIISPAEEQILRLLILNKNQIVSFDLLADTLWGDQSAEKFSLYAFSKLIERLRRKLASVGLSPELIQTARGRGYLFCD